MLVRSLAFGVITLLAAGCASENVFIAHRTVVGVNAAVDSNQASGHLLVGYDRRFFTVSPTVVGDSARPDEMEAMTVLSCSEVEVTGITLTKFNEQIATGRAARELALAIEANKGSDAAAKVIFDCWKTKEGGGGG